MLDEFQEYGKSTRKFLCNPPDEIDVIQYAKEHKAEIQWLNWLIIKMDTDATNKTTHELREKTVIVWLNPTTLEEFHQILRDQLESPTQPSQGQMAPSGLYFAQGWLGDK